MTAFIDLECDSWTEWGGRTKPSGKECQLWGPSMPLPCTAGDLTDRHVSAPARRGSRGSLVDNNRACYLFAIRVFSSS